MDIITNGRMYLGPATGGGASTWKGTSTSSGGGVGGASFSDNPAGGGVDAGGTTASKAIVAIAAAASVAGVAYTMTRLFLGTGRKERVDPPPTAQRQQVRNPAVPAGDDSDPPHDGGQQASPGAPGPRRSGRTGTRQSPELTESLPEGWTCHKVLGRGTYGVVYLASAAGSGELCALKRCPSEKLSELNREFALLRGLRHPHIVEVYDFVVDRHGAWISMEWCPGGTLARLVSLSPMKNDEMRLKSYARQILLGLQFLHGKGIIHRDIKPDNILADRSGALKLSDFGLSRSIDPDTGRVETMRVAGTPAYISPEIAYVYKMKQGRYECSEAGDIWAVAATLTHIATGDVPWLDIVAAATNDQLLTHIAEGKGRPGHHPTVPAWLSALGNAFFAVMFHHTVEGRTSCTALLSHAWLADAPRSVGESLATAPAGVRLTSSHSASLAGSPTTAAPAPPARSS